MKDKSYYTYRCFIAEFDPPTWEEFPQKSFTIGKNDTSRIWQFQLGFNHVGYLVVDKKLIHVECCFPYGFEDFGRPNKTNYYKAVAYCKKIFEEIKDE